MGRYVVPGSTKNVDYGSPVELASKVLITKRDAGKGKGQWTPMEKKPYFNCIYSFDFRNETYMMTSHTLRPGQ